MRGIADPDRMIKMGWSGGGHMTNQIITVADRFKAASSGALEASELRQPGTRLNEALRKRPAHGKPQINADKEESDYLR